MSSLADSGFNLQDYAEFCDLDALSDEDVAAVIAVLFADFEFVNTQKTEAGPSTSQEHNSVAMEAKVLHVDVAIHATIDAPADVDSQKEKGELDAEASQPPPPPVLEHYCTICTETKPQTQFFGTKFCTHTYCNDCIGSYVTDKVQDGIVWINCPGPDCQAGFLDPDACRGVLPRNIIDWWGDLLCESTIQAKFYCPFKDCSALLMGDNGSGGEEIITQSVCPHCHRMFCAQCQSLWHEGLKCEDVQKLSDGDREREDLKLKEVAESSHWKRCPECKYFVEKHGGCNHITCRCKYEFCYRCGANWKPSHYGCAGAE